MLRHAIVLGVVLGSCRASTLAQPIAGSPPAVKGLGSREWPAGGTSRPLAGATQLGGTLTWSSTIASVSRRFSSRNCSCSARAPTLGRTSRHCRGSVDGHWRYLFGVPRRGRAAPRDRRGSGSAIGRRGGAQDLSAVAADRTVAAEIGSGQLTAICGARISSRPGGSARLGARTPPGARRSGTGSPTRPAALADDRCPSRRSARASAWRRP